MKAVWKFSLSLLDEQTVFVPCRSTTRFLDCQLQNGALALWALVDPRAPGSTEPVTIKLLGTGHEHPDKRLEGFNHLSTVQMNGGALVWHVFVEDVTL